MDFTFAALEVTKKSPSCEFMNRSVWSLKNCEWDFYGLIVDSWLGTSNQHRSRGVTLVAVIQYKKDTVSHKWTEPRYVVR